MTSPEVKTPKTRAIVAIVAIVAKAHGLSEHVVQSAVEFSRGLDSADEGIPGFKDSVLTGGAKAPKSVIAALPKMEEPERKKAVRAIHNLQCEDSGQAEMNPANSPQTFKMKESGCMVQLKTKTNPPPRKYQGDGFAFLEKDEKR